MIVFPATPALRTVEYEMMDFGFVQRPATGAGATRIDRPGLRYRGTFAFPPMAMATAQVFEARVERGMSEGARLVWPLVRVSQGLPGGPTVNGGDSAGTTLKIKSATPGYQILEGYWLNVVDGAGVHYLHRAAAPVTISGGGTATVPVWPPLRTPLANGNQVILDAPKIEGLITGMTPIGRDPAAIVNLSFTLEETA